jgi:energy-coupling factor transport system permease protein
MLALFAPPFFSASLPYQAAFLAVVTVPALAAGAAPNLWRLRTIALSIFAVSFLLWTLTLPGQTLLVAAGPLVITQEAALLGLARALRLLSFLVVGIAFLTVTSVEQFSYGLRCLGLPFRVGFSITLAFRLAPLFIDAAEQIANAQRTRGLDLDAGNIFTRGRRYVPLLVPIIVAGFRRADGLAVALEAKGFGLPGRRTYLAARGLGWRDALLLCSVLSLTISANLCVNLFVFG